MTIERAVAILNEKKYGDLFRWRIHNPLSAKKLIVGKDYPDCGFTEFEAIAIAEKLERDNGSL